MAAVIALVIVVVLVAGGLVIDLGMARASRRLSQDASDAAAPAAGNVLLGR